MGHIMGRITTHVLDTAHGKPGQGVAVQLYQIKDGQRIAVCSVQTNADGRCDQPLLESDALNTGVYEIDFDVGSYFQKMGVNLPEPSFLGVVTLRFGVAHPQQHYHVPLVVTPWSYSTYRGS
ncbi:5-hydroxyisourate hydrolase [Undibacterium sp. GrIS 1.8]